MYRVIGERKVNGEAFKTVMTHDGVCRGMRMMVHARTSEILEWKSVAGAVRAMNMLKNDRSGYAGSHDATMRVEFVK